MISNYLNKDEINEIIEVLSFEHSSVNTTIIQDDDVRILDRKYLQSIIDILKDPGLSTSIDKFTIEKMIEQVNFLIDIWNLMNLKARSFYYKLIDWFNSLISN